MDLVATFGNLGDWHEVATTMSVVGDVNVRDAAGVEIDDESRQRAGRSVGADDFRAQSQLHRSCHLNPPIVLPYAHFKRSGCHCRPRDATRHMARARRCEVVRCS
jgi:hypothetical protein